MRMTGIISGDDGATQPLGLATRAQAATVFTQLREAFLHAET